MSTNAVGALALILLAAANVVGFRQTRRWRGRAHAGQAAQQRIQSLLLASGGNAVFGASIKDGLITFFNKGAEELTGYRADELIGKHSVLILHQVDEIDARMKELDLPSREAVLIGAARMGSAETLTWTFLRKGGSPVPVRMTISPESDEAGQIVGFIGIARDITEELRNEQEIYESLRREREMVSKLHSMAELRTEFVQNVSHEMRTPLTNILGYTELLLLGDLGQLDAQQLKTMTVVEINGRRLLDLVDDLLMLTRFDANPVHAEQSEIDLTEVIEGALETIRPVAERARVTVTFDLEPGLLVMGNVPQLERVAINILSNAVKFTPCDGLINIGLTRAEDAVLTICDTGVGIPSDDLERVFDRFFRAENALEQAIPGTGLGLIIAREILDAHDGSITLESEIGRGTAVTITIPRVDSRVGANEVATDAQSAALIEST